MLLIWMLLQRRNKCETDESGSVTDGEMKYVMPDLEKLIEDIIIIIKQTETMQGNDTSQISLPG